MKISPIVFGQSKIASTNRTKSRKENNNVEEKKDKDRSNNKDNLNEEILMHYDPEVFFLNGEYYKRNIVGYINDLYTEILETELLKNKEFELPLDEYFNMGYERLKYTKKDPVYNDALETTDPDEYTMM